MIDKITDKIIEFLFSKKFEKAIIIFLVFAVLYFSTMIFARLGE